MAIKAVRGVRDILPSETGRWQRVEAAGRATFEAYGYREIRLPLFERTELFARGIGDETDIVNVRLGQSAEVTIDAIPRTRDSRAVDRRRRPLRAYQSVDGR
jgi:hypothetical protein